MQKRRLGATELEIPPLVLGGNVFGWTVDKETSFTILDAALDAGINVIDTADVYSIFAPGHVGGESETILGEWMKDRGVRDRVIIITKGGLSMGEGKEGLGKAWLPQACEDSLRRLQTDYIDLYLSHRADPTTPIEESLEIFQQLIDAGKVRFAGCSNYAADELQSALAAAGDSRARYEVIQPHYNLAARGEYEGALEDVCARNRLGVITYFSLASGFLTGKYRKQEDLAGRTRGNLASMYMNPKGLALLERLDAVAAGHGTTDAQVALAWLMARPSVTAPIASATNLTQLADLVKSTELKLTPEDLADLDL